METSIEKTEKGAAHTEPSISPIETSAPKPIDLSLYLDRMDSFNSDVFEEAIEPPVQDKDNGNDGASHDESVEKAAQEERSNGDLEDFESFGETNSELKVADTDFDELETPVGDFEEKSKEADSFNGDLEELETPVGNSEERDELEAPVEDSEERDELKTPVENSEEKAELETPEEFESYDDSNNGTINGETRVGVNGDETVGKSEPSVVQSDEARNGEDGLNGDRTVISDGESNGEVQFYEEIPPEKIIQEFTDALPDLVIKQETEPSDKITGEDGTNGEEIQTGDLQSDEEILLEKIIRESRENEPVVTEEDSSETETGDVQSFLEGLSHEEKIEESKEIEPITAESDESRNGDFQSFVPREEKIEESREIHPITAESSENKNGDLHFFTPREEEIEKSRCIDQITAESSEELEDQIITTESTETETGELQSNLEIPKEEIISQPKETAPTPIFTTNPEITQNSATNNTENDNNNNNNIHSSSSEAPIIEEIYDSSSSSSDNDETSPTNPVPPPVPTVPTPPAGLGSAATLPVPSTTMTRPTYNRGPVPGQQQQRQVAVADEAAAEPEEQDEVREKLMNIRVKFLRLVYRLGQTPHNTVVAQVLYRLGLAEQLRRNSTRPVVVSFDRASILAEQLELNNSDPLDFSCTIMLLGKAGVGKSSTINSLFNDSRVPIHTFGPGTRSVNLISGNIHGINVKIIDTPGLSSSLSDTHKNARILNSVKKFVKKSPPDIVLYFDRLDVQSRDYGDVALLQSITNVFGPSIWFNAIIVLTHAGSAPPEGQNGTALSYDMFVTQRTHVVQQNIRQAAGDVRLMNPVSLVENHLMCRMNRAGKRVLPNGTVWEPQLLLLSFASKILGEANALLKFEDNGNNMYNMRGGKRNPPLPYFLSGLLQSRGVVKLPEEFEGDLDDDLEDDLEDSEEDLEEDDYDDLPPFKRLSKEQLERLNKVQKKAYLDEIEYREKLFFRKQFKEERKRRKLIKKMKQQEAVNNDTNDNDGINNNNDDINNEENVDGPGSMPVPMPDMALPASFDSDAPAHRYRFLDSNSQWLVRPVLDLHGWDHDIGYEGLNLERLFVLKNKIPVSVSGQLAKDKKESSLQLDVSSSVRHGEGKNSSFGLDLQAVGKDMSYTLRGETRFRNFRRNATSAGGSVTFLGDSVSAGVKLEDKLVVNRQVKVLVTGGAMTSRGDVACGARLEATFKDKDYPIGRFLSSLALSAVEWHGDRQLALSCQSQVPVGRGANLVINGNVNNKGSGQVGIRVSSTDQVGFALVAVLPFFGYFKRLVFGSGFE